MTEDIRLSQQDYNEGQQRRMAAVLSCFLAVAAVIIAKIVFTATAYTDQRHRLRQHALIHETLQVPGLRGTLVDHANQFMAQSRRCLELNSRQPQQLPFTRIISLDGQVDWDSIAADRGLGAHIIFRRTVTDIKGHDSDFSTDGMDVIRTEQPSPLGTTETSAATGLENGKSGLELMWDDKLRAELVICKILKDKRRVIISGNAPNGQDVHLAD